MALVPPLPVQTIRGGLAVQYQAAWASGQSQSYSFDFSNTAYRGKMDYLGGIFIDSSDATGDIVISFPNYLQTHRVFAGQVLSIPALIGFQPLVNIATFGNGFYSGGITNIIFTTLLLTYAGPLNKGYPSLAGPGTNQLPLGNTTTNSGIAAGNTGTTLIKASGPNYNILQNTGTNVLYLMLGGNTAGASPSSCIQVQPNSIFTFPAPNPLAQQGFSVQCLSGSTTTWILISG